MPTDCRPSYIIDESYIPTSTPTEPAVAPSFNETRSRLFAGGTFFRSKNGSTSANLISIEYVDDAGSIRLNVYDNNVLTETFGPVAFDAPDLGAIDPPLCVLSANPAMRLLVNEVSNLIQMPPLDHGGSAGGAATWTAANLPDDTIPGDDCAVLFVKISLTGGDGPPTDASGLASIYTGPERTLSILRLTEIVLDTSADPGILVDPPSNKKVIQWDGNNWIPYIPNTECPIV